MKSYTCVSCRVEKSLDHMAPGDINNWFRYQGPPPGTWRCYLCQYPHCGTKRCYNRSIYVYPPDALRKSIYYCYWCRYPPCRICRKERVNPDATSEFKKYVCPPCEEKEKTLFVGKCLLGIGVARQKKERTNESPRRKKDKKDEKGKVVDEALSRLPPCISCGRERGRQTEANGDKTYRCLSCFKTHSFA